MSSKIQSSKKRNSVPFFYNSINSYKNLLSLVQNQLISKKGNPVFKKFQSGYECLLCLTVYSDTKSFWFHTKGKRHFENLKFFNEKIFVKASDPKIFRPKNEIIFSPLRIIQINYKKHKKKIFTFQLLNRCQILGARCFKIKNSLLYKVRIKYFKKISNVFFFLERQQIFLAFSLSMNSPEKIRMSKKGNQNSYGELISYGFYFPDCVYSKNSNKQ
mmetsp:Transcript_55916/g.114281  ORF Transcript_55916/g.114281 Transcript_55916/m.114281 type:complete len:216 (-) Transcript_55916:845-1492(-)